MVTKRQYVSITIMMLVLFVLFQGTSLLKQKIDVDSVEESGSLAVLDAQSAYQLEEEEEVLKADRDYAVFIGDSLDNATENTVRQWCIYNKLGLLEYPSLTGYKRSEEHPPLVLLLDAEKMNWDQELASLEALVEQGTDVIFCNLPQVGVIQDVKALKRLLGINYIRADSVELSGIRLFGGFLLGGAMDYQASTPQEEELQDMELSVPWYLTLSGTKVYMGGILEDVKIDKEEEPTIIWRNSLGERRIFAVNGDYLKDVMGIGILNAMMFEMSEYQVYPIINAQNLVAVDYPVLAAEGEENMMQLYSRTLEAVSRDIIWPSIASVTQRSGLKLSIMTNARLDDQTQQQPDADSFSFYRKMLRQYQGEAGYSGSRRGDIGLKEKLEADRGILEILEIQGKFKSLYLPGQSLEKDLEDLKEIENSFSTLLTEYDPQDAPVSYVDSDLTLQRAVVNGFSHTYSEDLRVRCMETALGYSSILLNMERVVYPREDGDAWEKLSEQFSRNTTTYWKKFTCFEAATISECDARIRRFLALDYQIRRQENIVTIKISNMNNEQLAKESCWFLLRTHEEDVHSVSGGSAVKVEDNVYLIEAQRSSVMITLKESR